MNNPAMLFLFWLIAFSTTLSAQNNPQPYFRNYSTADGLPSPEVYCAFEDSQGYMWFGTDNGAARFDGYTFRTYSAQDGLTSNVVFSIFEDNKGRIWFGTMTGQAFILKGDTILPYRFNHLVQQYREQFQVGELVHLKEDETAYFELERLGFLMIDSLGRDSLITSTHAYGMLILEVEGRQRILRAKISWNNSIVEQMQIAKSKSIPHEFIIAGKRTTLGFPYKNRISKYYNTERLLSGHYLLFRQGYLYAIKENEVIWSRADTIPVNEIIQDEKEAIWLCRKEGNGLHYYKDFEALHNNQYSIYLNGLSVSNFYKDTKGGVWITTQEEGIFYCADFDMLTYDSRFGFSTNFISSLAIKDNDELYAGCKDGNIFHVSLGENRVLNKIRNPWGYQNYDMLYQASDDRLWNSGAYWKNGKWSFVQERHPKTGELKDFSTYKLDKLHINTADELLGCNYSGFYILDIEKNLKTYHPNQHNLRERTFAIHTDQNKKIWVGNAYGIYQFKDSVLVHPGIEHPAFHARIEDIDELPNGSFVLGTKGWGAIIWKGEEILQLSQVDGLTTNMIEDVHVDVNGTIWIGTLNGLNKIELLENGRPKIRQFTVSNGLPSNEVYKIRSFKEQIWLCTAKGLVKFHEQAENKHSKTPIFQQKLVNGREVLSNGSTIFSYVDNNFIFHYLAINYRQNGNILYRYRLEEEDEWQLTKNLSVNYPQLPSGQYNFEVQAQNEDGYWSSSALYAFEINPPWWVTGWFISSMILLAGMAGFTLYKYRIRQLKRENDIKLQISELERSALQAQMNPHFIFNCLSSIQNFVLKNDRDKAVEYLSRFARLVRLNLNASVEGVVALEDEIKLLDHYLALEQERFEHRFTYEITTEKALNDLFIEIPPLLIQPYVENAVIHGISQKDGPGEIKISFELKDDFLSVKIMDNGTGFNNDHSQEGLKPHKSVGMGITQKRLKLLNTGIKENYSIKKLYNENQESIGTEVIIFIKPQYALA